MAPSVCGYPSQYSAPRCPPSGIGQAYHAPLRDAGDLDVIQTAHDDPAVIGYCAARGIEVCQFETSCAV